MANQAKEARARLEASFRKQHEAERAAAKGRAEHDADARDTSVDRDRDTPNQAAVQLARMAVGRVTGAEAKRSAAKRSVPKGAGQPICFTDAGMSD